MVTSTSCAALDADGDLAPGIVEGAAPARQQDSGDESDAKQVTPLAARSVACSTLLQPACGVGQLLGKRVVLHDPAASAWHLEAFQCNI